MSETIRIRTNVGSQSDTYITTKIEQNFDFIEILSLKLSQEEVYRKYCSDYGVIIGRVTVNSNGFGVPNAKVSVFIPVSEEDKLDLEIFGLYPYEVITDKNVDGVRYNLLPKEPDDINSCYTQLRGKF